MKLQVHFKNAFRITDIHQGRMQDFYGGGGGRKRLCTRAHYESGTELTLGRVSRPA